MISKSVLFLLYISAAAAAALDCTGNDALLQVNYTLTKDEWNFKQNDFFLPFLKLPGHSIPYRSFADLVNFETCLPRDECSQVVVTGIPTDRYALLFDGNSLDVGVEFSYVGTKTVTSTEVGTCITAPPTCKDTEALVEVQYWSSEYRRKEPFRIEDRHGDTVIKQHGGTVDDYSLDSIFACIARDSCYTFLTGRGDPNWTGLPPSSYSLFFDGELVQKSDRFDDSFESVQFGDTCQPRCNQNNESIIEFFLHDPGRRDYEFKWDLKLVTGDSWVARGVVSFGPDKSPLYHKTMCIPKGSCSSFSISISGQFNVYGPALTYSLSMDNTIYRQMNWRNSPSKHQTIIMGSCAVGGLCDEKSQDLFDLELHTAAEYKLPDERSSLLIPSNDIAWDFGHYHTIYIDAILSSSQYISAFYKTDSSYRTIECVPNHGRELAFFIPEDSAFENYTVKKNGVQLEDSQEFLDGIKKWIMTPFPINQSQSRSQLSGGAIAGIVIACLVLIVLIAVIMKCLKRQEERNQHDEEDPLSESLL
eukprot:scaffold13772_cov154-Skeletonema_dohrnii-CCMP3373.AAC.9